MSPRRPRSVESSGPSATRYAHAAPLGALALGLAPAALLTGAWIGAASGATSVGVTTATFALGGVAALAAALGGWLRGNRCDDRQRLQRLLEERTRAVAERERDLRRILDHVPVAVLTLDAEGRVGPVWSLTAECLLGTPDANTPFATHLSAVDPSFARRFSLGWEQVSAGVLPVELALDQLPKQLRVGQHHFRTCVVPIDGEGDQARYLVLMEETTAALQRRSEEEANLEFAASLARYLRDRGAFEAFLAEAADLAACIAASTVVDARLRHALHTLKGNALMMGLEPLAHDCHLLESLIAATGDVPTADARSKLSERVERLSAVYGARAEARDGRADIRREDLDALVQAVARGEPHAQLFQRATDLLNEPAAIRLDRLVEHTASLAKRLGRPPPACSVVGGAVRVDRGRYDRFWSALGHVARNALTHGIEVPAERARKRKPERGSIVFTARATESELVIEIADDGRGIDWEAVRAKAHNLGLPSATQRDLTAALFADGLSTAAATDEFAGRGVGLGAVLAAVQDLGGGVDVESGATAGTCFQFRLPRSTQATVGGALHDAPKSGLHARAMSAHG